MAVHPAASPVTGYIDTHTHLHGHAHPPHEMRSIEADNAPDPYHTAVVSQKALEIESIRQALMHGQDKPLWQVLDEARLSVHRKALNNPFLMDLFTGKFCQTAFMKYLVNLLPIHEALEEVQMLMFKHAHLKAFVMPVLFRSEGIKKDLTIWGDVKVCDSKFIPWMPCEIALKYADSIRELGKSDPESVVGIMYAFYGTIMSGGQTNKVKVEAKLALIRSYTDDVPVGSGVAFYELRAPELLDLAGVATFKQAWHVNLSKVQDLLQGEGRTGLEQFQSKIKAEVVRAIETLLRIVETNVEANHC